MLKNFDWDSIKEELTQKVVQITFKKANGDMRVMQATLAEYLLPGTSNKPTHSREETMVVFDLEIEAWRSFRFDRVIAVEVL